MAKYTSTWSRRSLDNGRLRFRATLEESRVFPEVPHYHLYGRPIVIPLLKAGTERPWPGRYVTPTNACRHRSSVAHATPFITPMTRNSRRSVSVPAAGLPRISGLYRELVAAARTQAVAAFDRFSLD